MSTMLRHGGMVAWRHDGKATGDGDGGVRVHVRHGSITHHAARLAAARRARRARRRGGMAARRHGRTAKLWNCGTVERRD